MEKEIWKDVPNYEGYYQVSNLGNVRSLDRIVKKSDGHTQFFKGRLIKQKTDDIGRRSLCLKKNGKQKDTRAHMLVALAFIGERPEGYHVCHIDGNASNNNLENLRYDTPTQNRIDIYRNNRKGPKGKLYIKEVLEIRELYKNNIFNQNELSELYKVNQSSIGAIIRKEKFKWLNDDGTINESRTQIK